MFELGDRELHITRRWWCGGRIAVAGAVAALLVAAQPVAAACKLARLAELPTTMIGRKAMVAAKINGQDAQFAADSGAFFSSISRANAEQYGLHLRAAPFGFTIRGVTGETNVEIGTAREITFAGIPLRNLDFFVGGSEVGAETAGLLGQNILRVGDAEYDLANGAIRLWRPHDCGHAALAYWVKPEQPYSVIAIEATEPRRPHTVGQVYVNGVRLRAIFDTGAATSILTRAAAARAGVKIDSAGVVNAGRASGIGRQTVQSWIGPIRSFKIGDEEVTGTRIRFGDIELTDADLLLGADFFLSHRVYVSTSQGKLYFTYNGGAVFNLEISGPGRGVPGPPPDEAGEEPADAAAYSRRGTAYLARHDLLNAIADLNRAVELAPTDSQYVYQRALADLASHQPAMAGADLDRAVTLKPDNVRALVARAELRRSDPDRASVIADLAAADRLAAKQDDLRLPMANVYEAVDRLDLGVRQLDLWSVAHPDDPRFVQALNGRCWMRAQLNQDLDKALADCNAALRRAPATAAFLDSRGLVFLRLKRWDKAVADYDAALKLDPRLAWSLYGRGLTKLHRGDQLGGEADIAAAAKIAPKLSALAKTRGLEPSVP